MTIPRSLQRVLVHVDVLSLESLPSLPLPSRSHHQKYQSSEHALTPTKDPYSPVHAYNLTLVLSAVFGIAQT